MREVVACWPPEPIVYRYLLKVQIAQRGGSLAVIQKNPSMACAVRSDPTVGKVEAWARRHEFAAVTYVNLFAFRSTTPSALNDLTEADAIGPENDAALVAALEADTIVAAWGNPNGIHRERYDRRVAHVLDLVAAAMRSTAVRQDEYLLHVVGSLTGQGHPRHGLHWNGAPALAVWQAGTNVTVSTS